MKYPKPTRHIITFTKELIPPVARTPVMPFSTGMLANWLRKTGVRKYPDLTGVTSLNNCPAKLAIKICRSGASGLERLKVVQSASATKVEAVRKKATAPIRFMGLNRRIEANTSLEFAS